LIIGIFLNSDPPKEMDYISEVRKQGRYGPTPPEIIVYPTNVDLEPIIWRRRSTTYDFEDYQGGFGERSDPIQPDNLIVPWLMPFQSNTTALEFWIYGYLLKDIPLNLGLAYLQQIYKDRAEYPEEIHYAIKTTLDRPKTIGQIANNLGLYLPRLIRNNPQSFFYKSLYWLRQFRPVRQQLAPILDEISSIDLYLVTPNPYELFPGRKLLSYYRDDQLYHRFGRIGNEYLSKDYLSKRDQLDSFVRFTLNYFGFFEVLNWSRPIRLRYSAKNSPSIELSLHEALEQKNYPEILLLRLGIQLYASLPRVHDLEAWEPLIQLLETRAADFYNLYLHYKMNDFPNIQPAVFEPILDVSFEVPPNEKAECLICNQARPISEFSLCGHPICLICQALTKSAACPICGEHVTADALDSEYIQLLFDPISPSWNFHERIQEIQKEIHERSYKFDWSTKNVSLFGFR